MHFNIKNIRNQTQVNEAKINRIKINQVQIKKQIKHILLHK